MLTVQEFIPILQIAVGPVALISGVGLLILSHRTGLLQRAILFSVFCVLFAAVLVITLFFTVAFRIEDACLIGVLFICALGSLIFSLVAFIRELNQSLVAFHLDIGEWPKSGL